jgi:hypothetical protein
MLEGARFFLITYCCHFEGGNLKVLEHKAHALRTFILQLRTFVDFVQRPRNVWEDGNGLDHMETFCSIVDWIHFFQDMGQWCALYQCGDEQLVSCGMWCCVVC